MATDMNLEGIVLHSPDIDRLSKFYASLLDISFEVENIKSEAEEKRYSQRRRYVGKLNNGLPLILTSITQEITPTPSLIFRVKNFNPVLQRVKEYINDDVEEFPYSVGIHDSVAV